MAHAELQVPYFCAKLCKKRLSVSGSSIYLLNTLNQLPWPPSCNYYKAGDPPLHGKDVTG